MEIINLRPHHLLCIPGFKGHGYSREFELNMQKVIDSLNQGIKAKITLKNDDICRSCTNPQNNVCSNEFVTSLDTKVMDLLNLEEGQMIDFKEKLGDLKNKMSSEYHKKICSECIWMKKGICENTFK